MKKWMSLGVIALVMTVYGCGGGGSEPAKSSSPAKPAAPAAGDAKPAASGGAADEAPGTIKGRITYSGPQPRTQNIRMAADPFCDKANEGGYKRTIPKVAADGGLADVLVYIKSGLAKDYPVPSEPVTLNQVACNYTPSVLGAMVNQPIEILNSDATLHNVHSLPENSRGFNLGMPNKGMKSTRKFSAPELFVRIKCDVHPWMETHVGVLENPFHAVSGPDGSFEIAGVPPGEYEIEAAHPRTGSASARVKVESGGSATVEFDLEAAAKK